MIQWFRIYLLSHECPFSSPESSPGSHVVFTFPLSPLNLEPFLLLSEIFLTLTLWREYNRLVIFCRTPLDLGLSHISPLLNPGYAILARTITEAGFWLSQCVLSRGTLCPPVPSLGTLTHPFGVRFQGFCSFFCTTLPTFCCLCTVLQLSDLIPVLENNIKGYYDSKCCFYTGSLLAGRHQFGISSSFVPHTNKKPR